jgi:predicted cupin superfamily sugar epimerase
VTAAQYVQALDMRPHPEGGFYAETYRSTESISNEALPERFTGARFFSTAIYFLLESHHISTLHRIQADEIWHFYAGDPLNVYVIDPAGLLSVIRLGKNLAQGEVFQAVVPAGCWFGAKPAEPEADDGTGFSLVGCTVAPGFDFADFEMADRDELSIQYPEHRSIIDMLTV